MATLRMKRRIKRGFSMERPTVRIGKGGVSAETLNEIARQLEKRGVVKVKILKSALQTEKAKDVSLKIAEKTGSTLIEVRGHTFTLYKRKRRRK